MRVYRGGFRYREVTCLVEVESGADTRDSCPLRGLGEGGGRDIEGMLRHIVLIRGNNPCSLHVV
ncbi:hypothetical protein KY285_020398 [Solanum tuberosum]|nr:hypothetical protein KY289_020639 [Solanum tuberosum]KAH0693301.1 hypothetical protein KY285_020398 [Solanum tuberosum]